MVASGLPISNGTRHAEDISTMALHFLSAIKRFKIRHLPNEKLALRIGINSGMQVNYYKCIEWRVCCALHLTHSRWVVNIHTHTHTHTHTHCEHTPRAVGRHFYCGVVGGSVAYSRDSPLSWYWGWKRATATTAPNAPTFCKRYIYIRIRIRKSFIAR